MSTQSFMHLIQQAYAPRFQAQQSQPAPQASTGGGYMPQQYPGNPFIQMMAQHFFGPRLQSGIPPYLLQRDHMTQPSMPMRSYAASRY